MTERSIDELGPVDYLIIEFPADQQNFSGESITELVRLHDAGTIRIMDLLILIKNEDGSIDATELEDLPELGELQRIEADLVRDPRGGGRHHAGRGDGPRERGRRARL